MITPLTELHIVVNLFFWIFEQKLSLQPEERAGLAATLPVQHRIEETFMPKWISGNKVLEELADEELLYYLSRGLQPYSRSEQQPIPCDYSRHKANYLFECKHKKISARLRAIDYFLQYGHGFHEQQGPDIPANNRDWLTVDSLFDLLDLLPGQAELETMVVTPEVIEKLRFEKDNAEKELAAVESEIEAIVDNDPDFQDWRYLIIPEAQEEVREIVSSLAEALFKHEDFEKCSGGETVCHYSPFRVA